MGHSSHNPPRTVRNVLRFRHLGHLRTGTERNPVGAGQFLPHAAAQWSHLAHRGNAHRAAIHIAVLTTHHGHHVSQSHADEGLGHRRARRVQRLHFVDSMDRPVSDDKSFSLEIQERVKLSRLRVIIFILKKTCHSGDFCINFSCLSN